MAQPVALPTHWCANHILDHITWTQAAVCVSGLHRFASGGVTGQEQHRVVSHANWLDVSLTNNPVPTPITANCLTQGRLESVTMFVVAFCWQPSPAALC